jgi:peptidoglycan hydrolase-like protein with peptidoglycan-binding domain
MDNRRLQMARNMRARQKRNSYTNSSARERFWGYPKEGDNGSSDCSSAVRLAIQRVTGFAIGSNTVGQVNNNMTLEWIEFANGRRYPTVALMPGDLLYFKGTDKSRPYMVGHVEMVDEDTAYLWGHGSGTGPRRIKLKDYCDSRYKAGKGLIGVKRVLLPGEAPSTPDKPSALGKRLLKRASPMMRGEDVRELQTLLLDVGFDCDGIDGYYGINTEDAVRAFQYAYRLLADGQYGPLTHAALMGALEAGDEDDAPDEVTVDEPRFITATGDVWIRTLPSTSGARSAVLREGSKLERAGEDTANWYGVLYNGKQRYVSRKYAKAEE